MRSGIVPRREGPIVNILVTDMEIATGDTQYQAWFGGAPGRKTCVEMMLKSNSISSLCRIQKKVFLSVLGLEKMRPSRVLWSVRYVASNLATATIRALPSSSGQARLLVRSAKRIRERVNSLRGSPQQDGGRRGDKAKLGIARISMFSRPNVDFASLNLLAWPQGVVGREFPEGDQSGAAVAAAATFLSVILSGCTSGIWQMPLRGWLR